MTYLISSQEIAPIWVIQSWILLIVVLNLHLRSWWGVCVLGPAASASSWVGMGTARRALARSCCGTCPTLPPFAIASASTGVTHRGVGGDGFGGGGGG